MPDPSYVSAMMLLQDANTQSGIPGVQVFVNGQGFGPTDDSGRVLITCRAGQLKVRVVAAGYKEFSAAYNVANSQSFPNIVLLVPLTPLARKLILKSSTPSVDVTFAREQLRIGSDGSTTTSGMYTSGQYATLVSRGANTTSGVIQIVERTDEYVLPILQVVDPGIDGSPVPQTQVSAIPFSDPAVTTITAGGAPQTTAVDASLNYEWIYPNSSNGKYFTTSQARIYIGNLFIDEVDSIQFALQGNRIPVYGYCSQDADAFGRGRRLVQGQIALNFISEGYLYTVLAEHKRLLGSQANQPTQDQQMLNAMWEKKSELLMETSQTGSIARLSQQAGVNPVPVGDVINQVAAIDTQIAQLAAKLGSGAIDAIKKQVLTNSTSLTAPKNAIYTSIPFDIVIELEGAGRMVTKKLQKCLLISSDLILDQSGNPLRETYGFVARTIN